MRGVVQLLAFLWASPYTLLGLCIGGVGLCTGGGVQRCGRVIEFYGGGAAWVIRCFPEGPFILAFTLGHVVVGQSLCMLDEARAHEMVHVRQFERWGPLMGPAYLLASLYQWLAGRRPYRDNPFEREAYAATGGK
jgi:hypothetical protein